MKQKNSNTKKMNSNYDYDYYSSKKNYENENEVEEIHKFDLSNIDYNNNASGLSVFQNGNDEFDTKDFYETLPNLASKGKIFNNEFGFNDNKCSNTKNNKEIKNKSYKDAFLRKLLNSKKLNNNLEKLYIYNQRNKQNNKCLKKNYFKMRQLAGK